MAGAEAKTAPGDGFVERMRMEVDRAIQRNLRGLEYLGSPDPVVGVTPKTLLHRDGTLSLYHYQPMQQEVYRVPVLLVMAPTNKAFVFDMAPGQSMVEYLLQNGHDLYVMDWNAPSPDERHLRIEDYVCRFLPDCIRRVQAESGEEDLSIIGYCFGGLLAACYAARNPDGPLRNLVCFTTPVDLSKMQLFHQWMDADHFDVDRLVETLGIIPPDMITAGFEMLRPASTAANELRLWDNLWNDEYVAAYRRMKRWGNETLPLPGEYFRQIVRDLMQKNGLYEGSFAIDGRIVDLASIRVPLLHVMAKHDHIVPPDCGRPLVERVSSTDREELVVPGGHVSIIAGANAIRRMWPALNQWLEKRST